MIRQHVNARSVRQKRPRSQGYNHNSGRAAHSSDRVTGVTQRQRSTGNAQLERMAEEDELLQTKTITQAMPIRQPEPMDQIENPTGMPDSLKAGLEGLSGTDLSGVRVHRNSAKPAQLSALAYTQGQEIHVGPGQEKHLPHEGWHAVQQMQGRVEPTMQAKGAAINDDPGLEREADVMGAKALQMRRPDQVSAEPSTKGRASEEREVEPMEVSKGSGAVLRASGKESRSGFLSASGSNPSIIQRQPEDAGVPLPAGVPETSAISQELENIWRDQGNAALFQRLRNLSPDQRTDSDSYIFLSRNLTGDDFWLAERLHAFGPEAQWPIVDRVERELKGWSDSRGYTGVLSLVNGASTDDSRSILTNAHLMSLLKNTLSASQFANVFTALDVSNLISGAQDTQKRWILTDITLMNIIKGQLSAAQFTRLVAAMVNLGNLPPGKIQAAVAQLIVSPNPIDRNTAEKLINGHITAYYIDDMQQPANVNAVVTAAGLDPALYTVYLEPPENTIQLFVTKTAVGFTNMQSNKIFGRKSRTPAEWQISLIHETSHAVNADAVHANNSLERYKGEFRAYWVADYRNVANLSTRAAQIKAHILRSYPGIKARYDSEADFKTKIDRHTRPTGNLTNR